MARALRNVQPSAAAVKAAEALPKVNLVPRKLEYIPSELQNPEGHFHLVSAEIVPLTRELAKEFAEMEASVTERDLSARRLAMLRDKADMHQLVTFQWCVAVDKDGNRTRMNGQTSSRMLADLPDDLFPLDNVVFLSTYRVDNIPDDLTELFQQFDDPASGRNPADYAGIHHNIHKDALGDVAKEDSKLAIEGVSWARRNFEGLDAALKGNKRYTLYNESDLQTFIVWVAPLISIHDAKTPEFRKQVILAAMYLTWQSNKDAAYEFWNLVARRGVEFDDTHPTTTLSRWLLDVRRDRTKWRGVKPDNIFEGCVYSWNAYRKGRSITSIRYDADRGFSEIAA